MSLLYKLLLVLIALPTLFTLVHDVNRYYQNPEVEFKLRATGYYWVSLSPDSFKYASENLPPETWNAINKFLVYPGIYVFGFMALILYTILGIIRKSFFEPQDRMAKYDRLDFLRHDEKKKRRYRYARNK